MQGRVMQKIIKAKFYRVFFYKQKTLEDVLEGTGRMSMTGTSTIYLIIRQ